MDSCAVSRHDAIISAALHPALMSWYVEKPNVNSDSQEGGLVFFRPHAFTGGTIVGVGDKFDEPVLRVR